MTGGVDPIAQAEEAVRALPRRGHGSTYSYQYEKCRCTLCRAANATYHRLLLARYRATGGRGEHGTYYRWQTGCRCRACLDASAAVSREKKRKRREQRG